MIQQDEKKKEGFFIFEAERDDPCLSTIIYALTDRPVAYNGSAHRMSDEKTQEIMMLTIPDITKRYLIELWGLVNKTSGRLRKD